MRVCRKCGVERGEERFRPGRRVCKVCDGLRHSNRSKELRAAKPKVIRVKRVKRLVKKRVDTIWCAERKSAYLKQYKINNKEKLDSKRRTYEKNKRDNDPNFKIRKELRHAIYATLILNGSCKNNMSILKYLPYTIEDLKLYLESKFEWWMNWDNWGMYDVKTWNDNDPSTWKWNIDHIIPQSCFKYKSMEDEEFKRCWALENLRPYSAKQNILDGNRRK